MEKIYFEKIKEVLSTTEYDVDNYLELYNCLEDNYSRMVLYYRVLFDNTRDMYYKLMLEKSMYENGEFFDDRDMSMYGFLNFLLTEERYKKNAYIIGFPYEQPMAKKWGMGPIEENTNICGVIDDIEEEYMYQGIHVNYMIYPKSKLDSLIENKDNIFIIANPNYKYLREKFINNKCEFFCFDAPTVCVHGDQYFEEKKIIYGPEEVFFDAGADDFGVALDLLKYTQGSYKKIYAAEPLKEQYQMCLKAVEDNNLNNVVVENVGVWNENGTCKFSVQDGGSSSIDNTGETAIKVKSIDNIVQGDEVTLIKMDIEGAEYQAIEGAKNTITTYKPMLMICVYHKPNDVLRLYNLIKSFVPDYRLLLRHYSFSEYETVLYFYTEDRIKGTL